MTDECVQLRSREKLLEIETSRLLDITIEHQNPSCVADAEQVRRQKAKVLRFAVVCNNCLHAIHTCGRNYLHQYEYLTQV